MRHRFGTALALAALMSLALARELEVNADVHDLLGQNQPLIAAIDTTEGRALTVAIIHPDRLHRNRLATEIAARLAESPGVARVMTAPSPQDDEALIKWIWQHRFVLAPPSRTDLTADAMAAEMTRARAALLSTADTALADRYLRDPTGSFRRLIEALESARDRTLPSVDGISQARDNSAALIFAELAHVPFDVEDQRVFDEGLRRAIEAGGAEALVIGPRPISAQINATIETRSNRAALIACSLLIAWLAMILRPITAILVCLLPTALGFLSAALLVQAVFGEVHVIALGFGGALMGLAVDYPIHLLTHRADLRRARRLVGLGVATTAISFLALAGAELPAFTQVGLFVATGLSVSAISAMALIGSSDARFLVASPLKRPPATGAKPAILTLLSIASAALIWWLPSQAPQHIGEVPREVRDEIARLDRMIGLPSGQYGIDVAGETLGVVLDRQVALRPVLEDAVADGTIGRAEMLANFLPERQPPPSLSQPEDFAATAAHALIAADLDPGFLDAVQNAYTQALEAQSRVDSVPDVSGLGGLGSLIRAETAGFSAHVRLWHVSDPTRLRAGIAKARIEGVRFSDRVEALSVGLTTLTYRVLIWLGIGAGAGFAVLLALLRRPVAVANLALGCGAAALATLAAAGALAGGVGIFHIMALTLVTGIGIDYGCFLTLSESNKQFAEAVRSVMLCAVSTLIAFVTMALSGVNVLEYIGTTIAIGVLAMLSIHLIRRRPIRPEEK